MKKRPIVSLRSSGRKKEKYKWDYEPKSRLNREAQWRCKPEPSAELRIWKYIGAGTSAYTYVYEVWRDDFPDEPDCCGEAMDLQEAKEKVVADYEATK